MNINFNNVQDYVEKTFKPLPEGQYKTMLFSINFGETKNHEPMIITGFKVLNDPTDYPDRIIKDYFVLTNELGLSRLKKLLQLSNIDLSKEINLQDIVASGDLLGQRYNMQIIENEYTNKFGKSLIGNRIKAFIE